MRQGLLVKLKRIEKGYTVKEFSQMLQISREYLRLIENGKARNPSIDLMKKISEMLDTSVLELFFQGD